MWKYPCRHLHLPCKTGQWSSTLGRKAGTIESYIRDPARLAAVTALSYNFRENLSSATNQRMGKLALNVTNQVVIMRVEEMF